MSKINGMFAIISAALLLGLVASLPIRVSAIEEKTITEPRMQVNPVTEALACAAIAPLLSIASFAIGFLLVFLGFLACISFIGLPLGFFFILLGLFLMFILPIPICCIGSPIGFVCGFIEGLSYIPYDIGNLIIRLVDACVPG